MLSQEERAEIETEMTHYPVKRAVCIDAMLIVQRHRGWVSDESLDSLAQFLSMSTAWVRTWCGIPMPRCRSLSR